MSGNISALTEESEQPILVAKKKISISKEPSFNDSNSSGPFKVLLLGDSGVGKTSLIQRLLTGKFKDGKDGSNTATIGIDYKRKVIRLEEQNRYVKLQIWDTAGQERFRGLAKNYYRGADAVILVFDVTVARSFVDLPGWLEELENFSLDEREILRIIVANKVDLSNKRQVTPMCGQALADKYKLDYIEASAQSGKNVDVIFTLLAESLDLVHKSCKVNSMHVDPMGKLQPSRIKKSTADTKLRLYKKERVQPAHNEEGSVRLDYETGHFQSSSSLRCCII